MSDTETQAVPAVEPAPPAKAEKVFPVLKDAWPTAKPFQLNGFFERHRFSTLLTALLVLFVAFVLLNVVGAIAMGLFAIPMIMEQGATADPTELMTMLLQDAGVLLGGNAVALVVGMGLFAILAARLTSKDWKAFLRLRMPEFGGMGLAVLGWILLLPLLMWVAQLNSLLPLPQWLLDLEEVQNDMLEGALLGSDLSVGFLLIMVALTPAICEELMFRGYLQRQIERRAGLLWSIVGVGLLFGFFHLRLTQALPLSLLGIYMGYITWTTGSIWTASLVHLLHNGTQVFIAVRARAEGEAAIEAMENATVPWYIVGGSILLLSGVVLLMLRRREALVGRTQDAQPVEPQQLSRPPELQLT